MNHEDLISTLKYRAAKCVKLAAPLLDSGHYFLGGSCIASPTIRDIDVYPADGVKITIPAQASSFKSKHTKNSTTIFCAPPIQFCNYIKPDLQTLLESFDFSHIQAGAEIRDGQVISALFTESYLYAKACNTSEFAGSEYPLSSAVRLMKYRERGEISESRSIGVMLSIVSAVARRGFEDYEDFKDQLDAVDLGVVPEDLNDITREDLLGLFNALRKGE